MTKFSVSGESFYYELPQRALVDLGIVEMVAKVEYNRGVADGYALANKERQKIRKYCEQDVKVIEDLDLAIVHKPKKSSVTNKRRRR